MYLIRCIQIIALLIVFQQISLIQTNCQNVLQLRGVDQTKDSTIFSVNTNGNAGASDGIRAGKNGQGENRRILIRFDVSSIPSQSIIIDTTLELFVTDIPGNTMNTTTIYLHRLLQSWIEGDGVNMNGEPVSGAVTWNSTQDGLEEWTAPGGTYEPSVSALAIVPSILHAATLLSDTQMTADVQNWVNVQQENFGWIIIGDEHTTRSIRGFGSSENVDWGPVLHITYNNQTSHIKEWMLYDR